MFWNCCDASTGVYVLFCGVWVTNQLGRKGDAPYQISPKICEEQEELCGLAGVAGVVGLYLMRLWCMR